MKKIKVNTKNTSKVLKSASCKQKFPKKAKLISDGGLYKIVNITGFKTEIHYPRMCKIRITTTEIDWNETMSFTLKFRFDRVYKGYAEYRQYDCIKLETINKK